MAVAVCVEPRDSSYGLLRMIEILVVPEGRRVRRGGAQEERVFGVGDLRGGEAEGVDPDAVDGTFAILAGGGAHEKPALWDGDERGLGGGWCAELGVRTSCRHGSRVAA